MCLKPNKNIYMAFSFCILRSDAANEHTQGATADKCAI